MGDGCIITLTKFAWTPPWPDYSLPLMAFLLWWQSENIIIARSIRKWEWQLGPFILAIPVDSLGFPPGHSSKNQSESDDHWDFHGEWRDVMAWISLLPRLAWVGCMYLVPLLLYFSCIFPATLEKKSGKATWTAICPNFAIGIISVLRDAGLSSISLVESALMTDNFWRVSSTCLCGEVI